MPAAMCAPANLDPLWLARTSGCITVPRALMIGEETTDMATTKRRMGPQDSEVSNALLDATERLMLKEGYAALSSRRIAEEAGLKQQLVYYYFQTMDDLLLAAFKRRTRRGLERLEANLTSDRPLRAIWQDNIKSANAVLSFEYMALANHHDGIKAEVARFVTKVRRRQIEVIERHLADRPNLPAGLTGASVSFLLHTVALMLVREKDQGVTIGHDDVRHLVEDFLSQFDDA